jgi:SET domain-containing protein
MAHIDSNRQAPDLSIRPSPIQGRGVFTERSFLQGDTVLEIDDSDPVADRASLTPDQEVYIDVFIGIDGEERVTWMKSPERFINHSCDPNTYVRTEMTSGVRQVLALRDLRKGDELTWDYALNIWKAWVAPMSCNCGAENCRGIVRGEYFALPRDLQRRYRPLLDGPFRKRFAREIRSRSLTTDTDPA